MDSKSSQFAQAMQELESVTAQRDEEMRLSGEQQLSAVVRATVKKDKQGVERMMVIESAVRDVATASAMALAELQSKIDKGVAEVAMMVDGAKRATEDREAALREQINSALQKIRAYARDMEVRSERLAACSAGGWLKHVAKLHATRALLRRSRWSASASSWRRWSRWRSRRVWARWTTCARCCPPRWRRCAWTWSMGSA